MTDRTRDRHIEKGPYHQTRRRNVTTSLHPATIDALDDLAYVLGVGRSTVMRGVIEQWYLDNKGEIDSLQKFSDGEASAPLPHEMEFNFLLPGLIEPIEE